MKLNRIVVAFAMAGMAFAQVNSATRGIVPEEVITARPQPKATAPVAASVSTRAKYVPIGSPAGSPVPPRSSALARQVGVTIWRLRPGAPGEGGARILVQEEAKTAEWVPERVGSATMLKAGDRVRLTVESPGAGFLYVIDRETYATGERGIPYLIFPTTRTHSGDNRVTAGKLIDIPAQDDQPNFFSLHQSRPNQTEEELTLLLSAEPLPGISIGAKAVALTDEQVADWERRWGAGKVERFELAGGAGKAWTKAEQVAATDATRLLTQDDPPPQTVYRVDAKPAEPLLVKVRLRYSPGSAR